MKVIWYESEERSINVSIANYGLTFSADAIKAMGNPDYIKMGLDIEAKKIIVKICDADDVNGIEFKNKNKRNYVRIANKGFIKFLKKTMKDENIIDEKSSTHKAEWNATEKIMYISLDKEESKDQEW